MIPTTYPTSEENPRINRYVSLSELGPRINVGPAVPAEFHHGSMWRAERDRHSRPYMAADSRDLVIQSYQHITEFTHLIPFS